MDSLSSQWRSFLQHLSTYVIVIGALGLLNLFTSTYPWVVWPALAWGIGLAFHFTEAMLHDNRSWKRVSKKWRDFLEHLFAYVIVIGALALMNLFSSDYPWFLWPAFGWGIGLAIHFADTVLKQSKQEQQQVVRESAQAPAAAEVARETPAESRRSAEPASSPRLQAYLERARAYHAQIEKILRAAADDPARPRRQELGKQVADWVQAIEGLARRIENYQQNNLIRQDLEAVPRAIKDLETRLENETDTSLRGQLERTLASRKNQLAALEKLQRTMRQAEIQIESTLSALGTIYSQLLTGQSTDHVADYSRLSADVDEEVRTLQDQLEALEEVKLGRY